MKDLKQIEKEDREFYKNVLKLYWYINKLKAGNSPKFPKISIEGLNTPEKLLNELRKYKKLSEENNNENNIV